MRIPPKYSIQSYELPEHFISQLAKLDNKKPLFALAVNWILLILLVTAMRLWIPTQYFWWAYVPALFLIASRYGVFLQLIHEGSHHLLSTSKPINHFLATYLCGLPVGVQFDGYSRGHVRHHAYTNTDKDPKSDTEKYRIVDFSNPAIYLLFFKDLLGITAISIFFQYDEFDAEAQKAQGISEGDSEVTQKFSRLLRLCFVQFVILAGLFQFSLYDYILLWLVPAVSPHMILMRIRGIAEHGLAKQIGITEFGDGVLGNFYTRSFLTPQNCYAFRPLVWVEKILIGSLSVHYHHEHHLLPYIPYYNLAKLHHKISDQVKSKNPEVYARGYFAAALRNIRYPMPIRIEAIPQEGF